MNRIIATARFARPHKGLLARMVQKIRCMARQHADARRLETMPRERLADMGIPQRPESNRRSSGEAGFVENTPQW